MPQKSARRPSSSRWFVLAAVVVFVALAFASALTHHRRLEQTLGGLLIVATLTDVFLTVLYARMGASVLGKQVARLVWNAFRLASDPFPRRRAAVLSFAGPVMLVVLLVAWMFMLSAGSASIMRPTLGTSLQATTGETSHDFATALFAAAGVITSANAGDMRIHSTGIRLLSTFDALVGMSAVSLTLTYLMQVYTALQRRNTLGVKVHLLTGETGDAADALAGLFPRNRTEGGYSQLAEVGAEIAAVKESHHLYPVLFFFRFREPYYSVSRFTLVALDLGSLIKSALDDEEYAWLKESAGVHQLLRGSMRLVTTLEETFLVGGIADPEPPDEATIERWHQRYEVAVRRLQQAGIRTCADLRAGAQHYALLRANWDGHIRHLAPSMAYDFDEIDIACADPEKERDRDPFAKRIHDFA